MTDRPDADAPPDAADAAEAPPPLLTSEGLSRRAILLRRAGAVVAILLLIAAIYVVVRDQEILHDALSALRRPDPLQLTILISTVVGNIVLSGALFKLLMSRYGRVGWWEMQAVIAATTLLNYLPLRPGLLGRIAYHRAAHGIRVVDTTKTIVQAALFSVAIAGYLILATLTAHALNVPGWIVLALPVPGFVLVATYRPLRLWNAVAVVRYAEILLWIARYHAAFALLDAPIDLLTASALGCVSILATMVPFISNGLGLREWAIGLLGPLVTAYQLELAISAELINRAAELAVALVLGSVGLIALTYWRRRLHRPRRRADADAPA